MDPHKAGLTEPLQIGPLSAACCASRSAHIPECLLQQPLPLVCTTVVDGWQQANELDLRNLSFVHVPASFREPMSYC